MRSFRTMIPDARDAASGVPGNVIVRKYGCDGGGARVRAPGYRSVLQPLSGTAPGLAHEKAHADQGVMEMLLLHENSLPACVHLTTYKTSMNMGLVKSDTVLFPFYVAWCCGGAVGVSAIRQRKVLFVSGLGVSWF